MFFQPFVVVCPTVVDGVVTVVVVVGLVVVAAVIVVVAVVVAEDAVVVEPVAQQRHTVQSSLNTHVASAAQVQIQNYAHK